MTHSQPMMPDLFGEPVLPDGFRYTPDVLSAAEEARLVARFSPCAAKPLTGEDVR